MVRAVCGSGPSTLLRLTLSTEPRAQASAFWSADSRFVAFMSPGRLRKIEASGGPPLTLCDASYFGGAWNRDDQIIFGTECGIGQVSASGGSPVPLTSETKAGAAPFFLPDGRHFVYTPRGTSPGEDTGGIYSDRWIRNQGISPRRNCWRT